MTKLRAVVVALLIVASAVVFSTVSSRVSLGASSPTCPGVGCVGGLTLCAQFAVDGTLVQCFTTAPQPV